MTVLERKVKFITDILNDTDEKRFLELEKVYQKLSKKKTPEPCIYTFDEIRERARQQEEDLKEGKIELIPQEQIERKSIII